ncbi:MAG: DUF1566 domain-containing protein [Myxococcota bacterium]
MPNDAESAIQPTHYRVEGGVVTDMVTGLVWQQTVDPTPRALSDARGYCEGLDIGGRTDWRLPNRIELTSLLQPSRNPAIDSEAFPDTPADYFRATTYGAASVELSWSVYFGGSFVVLGSADTSSTFARCVAGGVTTLDPQFEITADDDVVLDRGTRLLWRRDAAVAATRAAAESSCTARGATSRLPTLKELLTIVDDTQRDPALDTAVFATADERTYWTATADGSDPIGFVVDFATGATLEEQRPGPHAYRCVASE